MYLEGIVKVYVFPAVAVKVDTAVGLAEPFTYIAIETVPAAVGVNTKLPPTL